MCHFYVFSRGGCFTLEVLYFPRSWLCSCSGRKKDTAKRPKLYCVRVPYTRPPRPRTAHPLPYGRGHGSSDSCCFSQSCATSCRLWTLLSSSPWTRPRTARLPPTRPSETDLPPARLLGLLLRRCTSWICACCWKNGCGAANRRHPPPPPPSDLSSDSSSSSPASDR